MTRRLTNRQSAGCWGLPVGIDLFDFLLLTLFVCLAGCATDAVPPSPDKPWYPSQLNAYEAELGREGLQHRREAPGIEVNTNKVYDLPELIDIAQRSNPQTRIAWEHARQAAAAVGLSESAYF